MAGITSAMIRKVHEGEARGVQGVGLVHYGMTAWRLISLKKLRFRLRHSPLLPLLQLVFPCRKSPLILYRR